MGLPNIYIPSLSMIFLYGPFHALILVYEHSDLYPQLGCLVCWAKKASWVVLYCREEVIALKDFVWSTLVWTQILVVGLVRLRTILVPSNPYIHSCYVKLTCDIYSIYSGYSHRVLFWRSGLSKTSLSSTCVNTSPSWYSRDDIPRTSSRRERSFSLSNLFFFQEQDLLSIYFVLCLSRVMEVYLSIFVIRGHFLNIYIFPSSVWEFITSVWLI